MGGFGLGPCLSWRCVRELSPTVTSRAGSEQFIKVDDWDGLSPVAERAELWHDKGFVLLFTQQREHVLHQLAEPAIPAETQKWAGVAGQQ